MSDSKTAKRGLGRGLSALMADMDLSEQTPQATPRDQTFVPIEQLTANPDQPRRKFDPEALQELADSLRNRGVLQPLIVRPHPSDSGIFQIVASVAGARPRWRSCMNCRSSSARCPIPRFWKSRSSRISSVLT